MDMPIASTDLVGRRSLDALFSKSARELPFRPALVIRGNVYTYRDLDARARRIEHTLRAAGLAERQANIGLIYARDVFTYAAVIATLRSGNVYVPLNPQAPAQRLQKMIADAGIETVIVDVGDPLTKGVVELLERSPSLRIITQAREPTSPALAIAGASQHQFQYVVPDGPIARTDSPEYPAPVPHLAYILYTSGSTGVPKGVAITHESAYRIINKFHWLFDTNEEDRFTQFSALSFDTSIMEVFVCWKSGGALYVPEASEALVPLKFAIAQQVSVWSSVPSLANFLLKLRLLGRNVLPHLRLTLFGGDALPAELAQAWAAAAPHSRIFNLYGPTEVTITSTHFEYDPERGPVSGLVPIGVPMPDLRHRIVDDGRVIEADDMPGELWLAGDQLAACYWNNPAATQAAFVRFPGEPHGELWYRTGDLVSWRTGMGLSFRGRLDRQVKLRGNRIELQEVESALREVIGCTLVAAVARRSPTGVCEEIVAWCEKPTLDEAATKERCLSRLPRYMVPDRILPLEAFPLTDHGKVDYLALAARTAALSS